MTGVAKFRCRVANGVARFLCSVGADIPPDLRMMDTSNAFISNNQGD